MSKKLYYGRIDDPNWCCGQWLATSLRHADSLGRPSRGNGAFVTEGWDLNPTTVGVIALVVPLPYPLEVTVNNLPITQKTELSKGDTWHVFIHPPYEQLEFFPDYV